jgi:benzylsuccinate CoA-transferase BbsF subunit
MEAMSGLSSRFGYADGPPQITHDLTYGDPVAGAHAAFAVMAALFYRRRTGRGMFIDVSQHETLLAQGGEAIVKYSLDGAVLPRNGAGDETHAPHGYFPCRGDDQWIAISVTGDEQWAALRGVLDDPALADQRWATVAGRKACEDTINTLISRHTRTADKRELAARLRASGVTAAPVLRFDELRDDPHVAARGVFERIDHPEAGERELPRVPPSIDGEPIGTVRAAPLFAQHNDEVFRDLLGMTADDVKELRDAAVIGDEPRPRDA